MSNMVNITEAQAPGMVLVDMETGTVLGTNVRLVFLPTYIEDAVLDSDSNAKAWAAGQGTDLFVDADDLPAIAQSSLSI